MTTTTNSYEIEFFSSERLTEFWQMVESLLKFSSIPVLIFVAIACAGLLLPFIIQAFKKGTDPDADKKNEDYDIKYYD